MFFLLLALAALFMVANAIPTMDNDCFWDDVTYDCNEPCYCEYAYYTGDIFFGYDCKLKENKCTSVAPTQKPTPMPIVSKAPTLANGYSQACEYDCDDPYRCTEPFATIYSYANGAPTCNAYCCPSGGMGLPQAGDYYCSMQQTCPRPPSRAPTTAAPTTPRPTTPTASKAPTVPQGYSEGCQYECSFFGCGTARIRNELYYQGEYTCIDSCCPNGGNITYTGTKIYCSVEQTCLRAPSRAPTQPTRDPTTMSPFTHKPFSYIWSSSPTQPTLRPTEAPTEPGCFAANNTVWVSFEEEEMTMPLAMRDLKIGDRVLVADDGQFEPIVFFTRHGAQGDDAKHWAQFLDLEMEDNNRLVLTPNHRVVIFGKQGIALMEKQASEVKLGDYLVGANGNRIQVISISQRKQMGAYLPVTRSGTIIVSGIKASCYVGDSDVQVSVLRSLVYLLSVAYEYIPFTAYVPIAHVLDRLVQTSPQVWIVIGSLIGGARWATSK